MDGIVMLPTGSDLHPTVQEVPQDLVIMETLPALKDQLHHFLGAQDVYQSVREATGVVGYNVRHTVATSRPEPF